MSYNTFLLEQVNRDRMLHLQQEAMLAWWAREANTPNAVGATRLASTKRGGHQERFWSRVLVAVAAAVASRA